MKIDTQGMCIDRVDRLCQRNEGYYPRDSKRPTIVIGTTCAKKLFQFKMAWEACKQHPSIQIRYAARLVSGKTADEFPDWFQILKDNR